jgi:hypothetical protein
LGVEASEQPLLFILDWDADDNMKKYKYNGEISEASISKFMSD